MSSNKAVAGKLIEVWKIVGSIEKKGRNPKFNYAFVREEDAADALRNAFIKVGLAVIPSVEKLDRSIIKTSNGAEMQHVIVTMKFTLTDKDTGESDSFMMYGEAADSFDKAVYKAITGCTKYAYVKLAMSGAEDNEDEDVGDRTQTNIPAGGAKPVQSGATYRKPDAPASQPAKTDQSTKAPDSQPAAKPAGQPASSDDRPFSTQTAPANSSEVPIMETEGLITAVIPAMKNKPASLSLKDGTTVTAITFDPKTTNIPNLIKLQSGKTKVKVVCDITSGTPHLMSVEAVA